MMSRLLFIVFFSSLFVFSGCSKKTKSVVVVPERKVEESSLGLYTYENEASEPIKKEVTLRPWKKENQLRLSINVTWTPGRTVEIESIMPFDNPSQMEFEFTDNFQNEGKARLERQEDGSILLTLAPTKINDRRSVMQYATFKLTKK